MAGPYVFDQIFAADPEHPERVAKDGIILIYAPGDPSKTPIALTDASTGFIIQNPVRVNSYGFGPTIAHPTLDQVAWEGGGLSGTFQSYRGMKEAATSAAVAAGQSAQAALDAAENAAAGAEQSLAGAVADAEAAKQAAQAAANLVGAPADSVVATLVASESETSAAVAVVVAAELAPISAEVAGKVSKPELEATAKPLASADNKSFSVRRVVGSSSIPEHYVTILSNSRNTKESIAHINALDSAAAVVPIRETLASMYARKRPNVIINAGGWWDTNRRMGLSIHNGVLIQDWDYGQPNWGVQAIVFYRDGTIRCEDSSTPGATLVANGAWVAMSQGKAAIKRGAAQDLANDDAYNGVVGPAISARQSIGVTTTGDIVIITFPGKSDVSGPTITQFFQAASTYPFEELYMLDAGGSTQMIINGTYAVSSSDAGGERPVVDAIAFYGSRASGAITTGWQPIKLGSGFTQNGSIVPSYMVRDGFLYLKGAISGAYSGTPAVVGSIPTVAASPAQYVTPVIGPGIVMGKLSVSWDGYLSVTGPASGLSYVNLSNCSWSL